MRRCAFTITHLTDRAHLWGTEEWEQQTPACYLFQMFAEDPCKVLGLGTSIPAAAGTPLACYTGLARGM